MSRTQRHESALRLQYQARPMPPLRCLGKPEFSDVGRALVDRGCRSIPAELKQAFREAVWLCSEWCGYTPEPEVTFPMGSEKISATASWAGVSKEFLPNDVYDKLLSMIGPAAKDRLIKDPSYESGGRVLIDRIREMKQS